MTALRNLSWSHIGGALGISASYASELYGGKRDRPSIEKIPCPQCGTLMSYNADLCLRCARARRSAEHTAPILEAIANGHHSISEIAIATGRRADVTRRYLATLVRRGVVTRTTSLGYHKRWLYTLPE